MTQAIVVALIAAISSSGVCSIILYIIQRRDKQKDKDSENSEAMAKMLCGVGHELISMRGSAILKRKWVSQDEYEDFVKYLYEPYKKLGGNGTAEKIMKEIMALPFRAPEQSTRQEDRA